MTARDVDIINSIESEMLTSLLDSAGTSTVQKHQQQLRVKTSLLECNSSSFNEMDSKVKCIESVTDSRSVTPKFFSFDMQLPVITSTIA